MNIRTSPPERPAKTWPTKKDNTVTQEVLQDVIYNETEKAIPETETYRETSDSTNEAQTAEIEIAKKIQRLNAQLHIDALMLKYDAAIERLDINELEEFVNESNRVAREVFGV